MCRANNWEILAAPSTGTVPYSDDRVKDPLTCPPPGRRGDLFVWFPVRVDDSTLVGTGPGAAGVLTSTTGRGGRRE